MSNLSRYGKNAVKLRIFTLVMWLPVVVIIGGGIFAFVHFQLNRPSDSTSKSESAVVRDAESQEADQSPIEMIASKLGKIPLPKISASLIVGIMITAMGVGIFIFGWVSDEYSLLMLFAILVVIVQAVLAGVFGIAEDYSFIITWYIAAAVMLKFGLVSIPLIVESGILILVGLSNVLPEEVFDKMFASDTSSTVAGVIVIILTVIVSARNANKH